MKIELFVLCDAADASQGKMSVFGIFDTIFSDSVPAMHPKCTIAARIRFDQVEGAEHTLKITASDLKGNFLLKPLESKILSKFGEDGFPGRVDIMITVSEMQFKSFGRYIIDLEVDGTSIAQIPFLVAKTRVKSPGPIK